MPDKWGWIRWLLLLLVLWIAYKVTFVCCRGTGTIHNDKDNCVWVSDPAGSAKKLLKCTTPNGTTFDDTTGVGSGGST
jgi:hypothetical protein